MDKDKKDKLNDLLIDTGLKWQRSGKSKEYIDHYFQAIKAAIEQGQNTIPTEVHEKAVQVALEDEFLKKIKAEYPELPEQDAKELARTLIARCEELRKQANEAGAEPKKLLGDEGASPSLSHHQGSNEHDRKKWIEENAFFRWEGEGSQHGDHLRHWSEAEGEYNRSHPNS